jgi:serine/threonine protein kinase
VMLCGERAVLIDFGAARDFAVGRTQQHSVVLTPGFAPLEQYARSARRGPFTDLYSLGGTLYYALTGSEPTPATERAGGAEMPPLPKGLRGRAPALASAVEAALALRVEERPQSAGEMLALLGGKPPVTAAPRPAAAVAKPPQPMPVPRGAPPKPPSNPTPAAQAQFMDKLIRWLRGL